MKVCLCQEKDELIWVCHEAAEVLATLTTVVVTNDPPLMLSSSSSSPASRCCCWRERYMLNTLAVRQNWREATWMQPDDAWQINTFHPRWKMWSELSLLILRRLQRGRLGRGKMDGTKRVRLSKASWNVEHLGSTCMENVGWGCMGCVVGELFERIGWSWLC